MLNMGFIEDIKSILELLPEEKQTVFFSATFPDPIVKIAKAEQKDPAFVRLHQEKQEASTNIEQIFHILKDSERADALIRLLNFEKPTKAIVFCRTKSDTENLHNLLLSKNFKAKVLHGDLSQYERNRTIQGFKSSLYNLLIATDIASRGLDVDDLSHVFNYQLPENYDRYTHRIGRTGRAGKHGKAHTFTTMNEWSNNFFLRKIKIQDVKLQELPNREETQSKQQNNLMSSIQEMNIRPELVASCKELVADSDPFDLLCKFFAFMNLEKEVQGPFYVGLPQTRIDELKQKFSKSKSFGTKSSSRRSGRGQGRRGSGKKFSNSSERKKSSASRGFSRKKTSTKARLVPLSALVITSIVFFFF